MPGENKNLKDSTKTTGLSISIKDTSFSISYTKTHKLITALYMVTDIIDKGEPIRNKLRTLGAEIVSDMHNVDIGQNRSVVICTRIAETVSFLNIASAMNFISEMNCVILKKEFLELEISVQEYADMKPTWLEGFFEEAPLPNSPHPNPLLVKERGNSISKGHTRIGVQKGSTLLKAIKDMSDKMPAPYEANGFRSGSNTESTRTHDVFDVLKKQRRDDILNIIKTIGGGATIKDIKDKIQNSPEQASFLVSCSEKTLQRELVSMVKDGVLNKTGEKRWSRYFVK
jgi:DNA-binding HxlR family transcriptional regulator